MFVCVAVGTMCWVVLVDFGCLCCLVLLVYLGVVDLVFDIGVWV